MSVRLKLTLSYTGFLIVASALLLGAVWVFLLRYVPEVIYAQVPDGSPGLPMGAGVFVPNRSDLQRAFLPKAAWAFGALVVFGLVGGWFLAGRMLSPLCRITEATRLAGTGSLSHRIHMEGRNDEFRELADSFDTTLGQLEAHVEEQQRFAANASHELRTPLAITQAMLDVARKDPERDADELIDRLRVVNTRAIDLTEALLVLSRTDQGSFSRERVDLSLVVEEAAETLLPLAEERGVAVETTGDLAPTTGSHSLLLQMATNLLHNAIVHNAIVHNVAEHGLVRIDTAVAGAQVVLTVENTGEVLDPQLVATLTEPFQRGAERARSDHAGVGLGLAIVDSIVRAHDGELALAPLPTGGLRVTVRLPAAP